MLASISIPHNLTRILASLKETNDSSVKAMSCPKAVDYNEEYNPEEDITANHSYGSGKCYAILDQILYIDSFSHFSKEEYEEYFKIKKSLGAAK